MHKIKICLVEPFLGGSHQQWAESYQKNSRHEIQILSLSGHHWKWRMYGGAVSLAKQFMASSYMPDLILATDMLDLTTFLALSRKKSHSIPVAVYFHENQITYPWSPTDKDVSLQRNNQYGFLNYTTALAADRVLYNSSFHLHSFLKNLPVFLKQFPDHRELSNIEEIAEKSMVLPLGMDLKELQQPVEHKKNDVPVILWNHRWEYDKGPELFFETLLQIKQLGVPFKLVVLGESYRKIPPIFSKAQQWFKEELLHFGFAQSRSDYIQWLWKSDILPVTSNQDFFGGSTVEAIYCENFPLLPNRLAFTEHIPTHLHQEFLYDTDEAFLPKLLQILQNWPTFSKSELFQNFVAHYDWSILAEQYDHLLENLLQSR